MHGHFCLRIENIFDDDDEVTKSKKLKMNQETMQMSYELFYLYATFPSLSYESNDRYRVENSRYQKLFV